MVVVVQEQKQISQLELDHILLCANVIKFVPTAMAEEMVPLLLLSVLVLIPQTVKDAMVADNSKKITNYYGLAAPVN